MGAYEWAEMRIGDLGDVFTGRTPPSERPAYFGNDFPFITPGDMRQGKYARSTERSLSSEGAELLRRIRLPENSVCVSCIGWQMGEVVMTDRPSATNQQINSIVSNGKVDPSFLYYSLRPRKQELLALGTMAGVRTPILNKSAFCDLKVQVPPLLVQKRIAGILSAYDELIENSQRRIKLLEAMARALYREWFVQFRFPGHESAPRVVSSLGEIPQGWEVKNVRQVAGLVSRGPSLTYLDSGGIQVVNQRCIRNDEIEMQAVQYAAPLSEKKSHLYLRHHDILINSMGVGTLGRVSRNLSIDEPTIIHNCITVVRGRTGDFTTAFLYYRLRDCQEHFESLGVGATGQTSLRIETIEDVQFALPPVELLSSFENVVLPMWAQIGVLKRQTQNLRRTRDLLLPRLLSGHIDVEALTP